MAPLMGYMAEELEDSNTVEWFTCRRGPLSVRLLCLWRTLDVYFNVEMWPPSANGSCIGIGTACPVGLKLRLCRVHAW